MLAGRCETIAAYECFTVRAAFREETDTSSELLRRGRREEEWSSSRSHGRPGAACTGNQKNEHKGRYLMRTLLLYVQPVTRDESGMGKGQGQQGCGATVPRLVPRWSLSTVLLRRSRGTLFTCDETGTQTQIRNATLCTGMRRYRVHGMRCLN
jgi:hypothetical protein